MVLSGEGTLGSQPAAASLAVGHLPGLPARACQHRNSEPAGSAALAGLLAGVLWLQRPWAAALPWAPAIAPPPVGMGCWPPALEVAVALAYSSGNEASRTGSNLRAPQQGS